MVAVQMGDQCLEHRNSHNEIRLREPGCVRFVLIQTSLVLTSGKCATIRPAAATDDLKSLLTPNTTDLSLILSRKISGNEQRSTA